jgi:uncharacterized surface protein with fasciclin (FAS1) repeats
MTTDDDVMRLFERANPVPDPGLAVPKVGASGYLDIIERKQTTMTLTTTEPEAPEHRDHEDASPWRPWLLAAAALLLVVGGLVIVGVRSGSDQAPADQPRPTAPLSTETLPAVEENAATIVDVAIANDFTTLVAAAEAAGLLETLSGDGPFTMFAPTDEAFADLPDGLLDALLLEENREMLSAVLEYHIVPGEIRAADLADGDEINTVTLQGEELLIVVDLSRRGPGTDGETLIGVGSLDRLRAGAQSDVVTRDLEARNGVVHSINRVMVPPSIGNVIALSDVLLADEAGG